MNIKSMYATCMLYLSCRALTGSILQSDIHSQSSESELEKFCKKDINICFKFINDSNEKTIKGKFQPDKKLAKKFLLKAQNPDKVSMDTFFKDYINQLKESIKLAKEDNRCGFNLLRDIEINLLVLYQLDEMTSSLVKQKENFSKKDEDNRCGLSFTEPNLLALYKLVEMASTLLKQKGNLSKKIKYKKADRKLIWSKRFELNNIKHLSLSTVKNVGSCLFMIWNMLVSSGIIPTNNQFLVAGCVTISLGASIYFATRMIKSFLKRDKRNGLLGGLQTTGAFSILFPFVLCYKGLYISNDILGVILDKLQKSR